MSGWASNQTTNTTKFHTKKPNAMNATRNHMGVPFTKIEKYIEELQWAIQLHHFSPKSHLNILSKKPNSHALCPFLYLIYNTLLALHILGLLLIFMINEIWFTDKKIGLMALQVTPFYQDIQ